MDFSVLVIVLGVVALAVVSTLALERITRGYPAQDASSVEAPKPAVEPPPRDPIRPRPEEPRVHEAASKNVAEVTRSIFISYRRGDSADVTGRMYDRFVQKFGRNEVFKDVDSIPLGMDFRKHLQAEVGRCSVCLVVIGRSWLSAKSETGARRLDDPRDHLRIEVEAALARDIPVIPILVQGATMPEDSDLPESIRGLAFRNAIAVRPDPDFHADVDRLIRGIEAHFLKPGPQGNE